MSEAALLAGVVRAMGLLVAVRDGGEDTGFEWVGQVPEWAESFGCGVAQAGDVAGAFAYLDFFIEEARDVWAGRGAERLSSDVWAEPDRNGVDHQLEAVALKVDGRDVLVVSGVGTEFSQTQSILQTARTRRLTMDRELAVRQMVEDQLRQRVGERTRELNQSNEQLRSLASKVALAEQRERHRLAIGLHDHIGQLLAVVKMQLSAERAKTENADTRGRLNDTLGLLEQAIASTRTLTFELSPPMLYELGLAATLASLVDQIQKRHESLACRFAEDDADKSLPTDVEVLLFQVVRELITNTLKHAGADRLDVSMRLEGGAVVLGVADDGRGFDPLVLDRPVVGAGGFGLLSVRERLAHFGASMRVDSRSGGGTRVRIQVPQETTPEDPVAKDDKPVH
ncbi:MAG: sensor histidine kinase [Planctomycetota bacterium]